LRENYKQFAVTIAISVFISGVVALTLIPTLCTIFLKPKTISHLKMLKWFDQGFEAAKHFYINIIRFLLNNSKLAYAILGVIILITTGLYKIIPILLMPLEDLGYYYTDLVLPSAASLDRTTIEAKKLADYLIKQPTTDHVLATAGFDVLDNSTNKTNAGLVIAVLKPWNQRLHENQKVGVLINATNQFGNKQKEAEYLAFNVPPIRGLSTNGGITFYLEAATNTNVSQLYSDSVKLVAALKNYPAILFAKQFYDISVPQLY